MTEMRLLETQIKQLAELLTQANYVIAFTGAGISTDSGIPDFRGQNGLWRTVDPQILSVDTLRADPELFYRYYRDFDKIIDGKKPNKGHRALSELSKLRVVRAVITQNADGLHKLAGSPRVFEVHGNLEHCQCQHCKRQYPYALLKNQLNANRPIPISSCCKAILRPGVVLFGDKLSPDFSQATEEAFRSDFALVIGTSLTVYPAADIPQAVGRFAIINNEETPVDYKAVLTIRGSISDILTKLTDSVRDIRGHEYLR
jgi:NAD-dependent deacetylase